MARFIVGIDLGTTNSALAYVDLGVKASARVQLQTFKIAQLTAPGDVQEQPLLPSFLYLPGSHDLPAGSTALPWQKDAADVVGVFARSHGAKVPGRLVSSAKSWLCHPGVDRTLALLPWGAPPEVTRVSPLEASAKYLKHMIHAWNSASGRKPEDRLEDQMVTITVPASFDDVARNLTADAAKQAGLKHFALLEEPQAAFYAWLGTHTGAEAAKLAPGMRCLVVDVGGGTSDFSLIRVTESGGDLAFQRDAVGDHLLLGGDNMDLALAKTIETKAPGGKLDAAQFGALVQACRAAKETMLSPNPPAEYVVTVMGRGRSVIASSISIPITREDVQTAMLDGFFPLVGRDAEPSRAARAGLQEMGLPYVADPAVTKHLAEFLRQHLTQPTDTIDAILFNGGVFTAQALRDRLIEVMRPWFTRPEKPWNPLILTSPSLDLAVAWGAAYAGWLKQSGGRRIGGGIPRSYYLGVEAANRPEDAKGVDLVCVVPRQLEEGQEITIPEPEFQLALGEPVLFPLYSSTVRGDDKPGAVLRLLPSQLMPLPPLHTVLRGGKRSGVKRVPVTLAAKCTEIGTLELYCVSQEGNRWKLEFNVRDVVREKATPDKDDTVTVQDVFPEEKVRAGSAAILGAFQTGSPTPAELPKVLEAAYESGRSDWPTALCRRMWDDLSAVVNERTRSPQHLARWYNLAGFSLRPGFGDPLDRYRIEAIWKLITTATAAKTTTVIEGGADYWIMWRRVAGGLNTALQQMLWTKLKPPLLQAKSKSSAKVGANELAEMWRAAASLERLDAKIKAQLGEELLRQLSGDSIPHYAFWSLTRLGARKPFYGPLNTILHPAIVEAWLEKLLTITPTNDHERMAWGFAIAQLARRTGLRGIDISDDFRPTLAAKLQEVNVPKAWPEMILELSTDTNDDAGRLFGESLPIGLKIG
ncbi:MAG: Hsp70 family protein [Fimbriiglobus sp.]